MTYVALGAFSRGNVSGMIGLCDMLCSERGVPYHAEFLREELRNLSRWGYCISPKTIRRLLEKTYQKAIRKHRMNPGHKLLPKPSRIYLLDGVNILRYQTCKNTVFFSLDMSEGNVILSVQSNFRGSIERYVSRFGLPVFELKTANRIFLPKEVFQISLSVGDLLDLWVQ